MEQTVEEAARLARISSAESLTTFGMHQSLDDFTGMNLSMDEIAESAFIKGAEWQQKQSKWINVEERYPSFSKDNNKPYLVRVCTGSIKQSIYYATSPLVSRNRFGIEMDWTKVTHWMPIPSFDEILEANRDVLERLK